MKFSVLHIIAEQSPENEHKLIYSAAAAAAAAGEMTARGFYRVG